MRPLLAMLLGLLVTAQLIAGPPEPPPPLPPLAPNALDDAGIMRPAAQQFKELVPALIEALKDPDPDVRQHTALALATIGQDALKPLIEALTDDNKERRA